LNQETQNTPQTDANYDYWELISYPREDSTLRGVLINKIQGLFLRKVTKDFEIGPFLYEELIGKKRLPDGRIQETKGFAWYKIKFNAKEGLFYFRKFGMDLNGELSQPLYEMATPYITLDRSGQFRHLVSRPVPLSLMSESFYDRLNQNPFLKEALALGEIIYYNLLEADPQKHANILHAIGGKDKRLLTSFLEQEKDLFLVVGSLSKETLDRIREDPGYTLVHDLTGDKTYSLAIARFFRHILKIINEHPDFPYLPLEEKERLVLEESAHFDDIQALVIWQITQALGLNLPKKFVSFLQRTQGENQFLKEAFSDLPPSSRPFLIQDIRLMVDRYLTLLNLMAPSIFYSEAKLTTLLDAFAESMEPSSGYGSVTETILDFAEFLRTGKAA